MDLGAAAALQTTGSMSWSAWVYLNAFPGDDGQIVAQSDGSAGWQFKTSPDTGVRTFGVSVYSGGPVQRYSKTVIALKTWYHVAGVYDSAKRTLDIYVNGILDNGVLNGAVPATQTPAAIHPTIGMRVGGYYFNGLIDNLRIYKRAITTADVTADMAAPVGAANSPTVSSLQCVPALLGPAGSTACTVTLSGPAPASGVTVGLTNTNALLTIPASVTVAAGATTGAFNATTAAVPSDQNATITATYNSSSASQTIGLVAPVLVSSLTCTPNSLGPNASSACTVTLTKAAPAGGATVALTNTNATLTVPASMTVVAGAMSVSFNATTAAVPSDQNATITATYNSSSASQTIGLVAPVLVSSLMCTPNSLGPNASSACTVTLTKTASGGATVALTNTNATLTVPASVTVVAGATSGAFNATTSAVPSDQTATITATYNGSSANQTIGLVAPVLISSLVCTPASLGSNASSACTVTLTKAALAGGAAISLTNTNPALTVPASVTVTAGATAGAFNATTAAVPSDQSATITASYNGSSANQTIGLMAPVLVSSLACSPSNFVSGGSTTCTITLSRAARVGGATVAVSSNNSVVTVPSSVTIPADSFSGGFSATDSGVTTQQTALITGSLSGSSAAATVTVSPAPTGPVAAYSMSEGSGTTTADSTGKGHTGTLSGAKWTTSGKNGNALSFNGSNNYVTLADQPDLKITGSMTLAAWVYMTGNPPDDGQIVARSDTSLGWQLKTSPDTGVRTFGIAVSDGRDHIQRYSKTVYKLNTWYYVAGVYDTAARTLDIYVNGAQDNGVLRGVVPASQVLPNATVNIGRRSGGYYFKGTIDDVRIYNRPLAAAEIPSIMNTPADAAVGGLVTGLSQGSKLVAAAARVTGPASRLRGGVSSLSCSPSTVRAGARLACDLRVTVTARPMPVRLASSSQQVKVPATVTTRENQGRLTFQAEVDRAAAGRAVTIEAAAGEAIARDTILVQPADAPVVTVPGKQFVRVGEKLEFAVAAADPAGLAVRLWAQGLPEGASFDPQSGRFEWLAQPGQAGLRRVTFAAVNAEGKAASADVAIEAGPGLPVVDDAKAFACSPGAIATIAGKWLAPAGTIRSDPTGGDKAMAGVFVWVNGFSQPIIFVSQSRVSFVCPNLAPGSPLSLAVATPAGTSEPVSVTMQAASPEILALDVAGRDQGMISYPGSDEIAMPRNFRVPAHPAQPGDRILIWATGLGSAAGEQLAAIGVKLGEITAGVESIESIAGYAGVYGIQVRVPEFTAFGDAVPVQLIVHASDGREMKSNLVTAAIEPVMR
ncbi:MAG TPA: LamG-like jellyroll fold domain-containing protein [Bryobacteraceae bacterium]